MRVRRRPRHLQSAPSRGNFGGSDVSDRIFLLDSNKALPDPSSLLEWATIAEDSAIAFKALAINVTLFSGQSRGIVRTTLHRDKEPRSGKSWCTTGELRLILPE